MQSWAFWQKNGFLKLFLTKRWRHFERRSCSWNNYSLMLNYWFLDYHLSVFQKLRYSDTCNQVKSCKTRLVLKSQDSSLNITMRLLSRASDCRCCLVLEKKKTHTNYMSCMEHKNKQTNKQTKHVFFPTLEGELYP